MSSTKVETEAKFIVPEASTFAALQKITRLGDFKLKASDVQTVFDRYLDTAAKQFYQAGFACRIRTVKDKQLLTLKSLTPAKGNIHRRQEIEQEIETEQIQTWAEGEAKRLVLEIAGAAALETLFTLYQTRHQFKAFRQGRAVIELSLDEVSLRKANSIDYFELEAELMEAGTEADLVLFVETLKSNWPLPAESQSKFERALASIKQS